MNEVLPPPLPTSSLDAQTTQVLVDIGSTMVKLAQVDAAGSLIAQQFIPRDFDLGVALQVEGLLASLGIQVPDKRVRVCSSANGGLRVGIVCLSKPYSGVALRNQVLLAGANPVYVHDLDEAFGDSRRVDILLVGGGIDCEEAEPLRRRLETFDPSRYDHGALLYCGNRHLKAAFLDRHARAKAIANPLGESLSSRTADVFEAVRRAYLEDIVYKEGVSELSARLSHGIRPTPEVASRGFLRASQNKSTLKMLGSCLALDIGGATTDIHYTVELIRDDSEIKPEAGISVARYVFTDLGVFASRDTLLLQLRNHPRLYEFLGVIAGERVRELYSGLREGDHEPTEQLLAYACLFIALDRFSIGRGPGLPTANLDRTSQIILTGGAAQALDDEKAAQVATLFMSDHSAPPQIQVDRRYQMWVDGMLWLDDMPASSTTEDRS